MEIRRTTSAPLRALAWSEWTESRDIYPEGIHGEISRFLEDCEGLVCRAAYLDEPECGLDDARLAETDVLFWWGHERHMDVEIEAVRRVVHRVTDGGMGFVAIHSAHFSRPFIMLMAATCTLGRWDETPQPERIRVITPSHPIAQGVNDFVIPQEEMYDEPFDVPEPETVIFESTFKRGGWFRSGCTWTVGKGRVFYFRPGHETWPTLRNENVQRILRNAAFWAAGRGR